MEYRLEANWEAVHFLRSLSKADQTRLFIWVDRLRSQPFLAGDFTVPDETGRELQVSRVGRFFVYHWSDHLVKTVRLMAIEEVI